MVWKSRPILGVLGIVGLDYCIPPVKHRQIQRNVEDRGLLGERVYL